MFKKYARFARIHEKPDFLVMQISGKYFLDNSKKNTSLSFLLPRSINGMCGRLELWNLTTFAENAICRGDFK